MGAAVAVPSLDLNRTRVPLGGPIEMTYRFTASSEIANLTKPYRVFVHFLDANGELLFSDDHDPPVVTTDWRPGETVTYERRMFIPVYPYYGKASIVIGLYSPITGDRLRLAGDHIGRRAYVVATIELASLKESSFLTFQDGWHQPEVDGDREWRWTTGEAIISFANPHQDSILYFELDGRPELFESPQRVDLAIGNRTIDNFLLDPPNVTFHTTMVNAGDFGDDDTVELILRVDQAFVPAELPDSDSVDNRKLGVRVFHAFLEPR